jgi:hypothetical protein
MGNLVPGMRLLKLMMLFVTLHAHPLLRRSLLPAFVLFSLPGSFNGASSQERRRRRRRRMLKEQKQTKRFKQMSRTKGRESMTQSPTTTTPRPPSVFFSFEDD